MSVTIPGDHFADGSQQVSEWLAHLLGAGDAGPAARAVAMRLLVEFGDAASLAQAHQDELRRVVGMTPNLVRTLLAAFELGRASRRALPRPRVLRSASDIAALVAPDLDPLSDERVVVIVCDARNAVRRVLTVSQGGDDHAAFSVREILGAVLRYQGSAFAVAHNHPSGDPSPSEADRRTTRLIEAGATVVGLRFLDHVVIAASGWSSASRSPLLELTGEGLV